MNSLERIAATVQFPESGPGARDRTGFRTRRQACRCTGRRLCARRRNARTCQLIALKQYGYDAVFSVMDVNVETEALGSVLKYRKDRYPVVEQYALSGTSDFSALEIPDCRKAGRCGEMLKALRTLRSELANEVLVVGCVMGPFTLATQLLGMEAALYLAIDDPSRLECLMDFAAEVVVRFGQAQLEAGAHLVLVFDPSASPAVVPPQFFREFELPAAAAGLPGPGRFGRARKLAPRRRPLQRNSALLSRGRSRPRVFRLLRGCRKGERPASHHLSHREHQAYDIRGGESRGHRSGRETLLGGFIDRGGFILSSGCEIPPESAPENVAALVKAAREDR